MAAFVPFETARLRLRPFRDDDAAPFSAYRSDPDVARYQSWDPPYDLATAARFVAAMGVLDAPVRGDWIQIAVEHEGTLAGDVAVGLSDDGRIATLGYSLAPGHQGRGLAAEAVGAVVERLFADLDVHRVEASIDPRNVASARLVEGLGFDYEGRAVSAVPDGDGWSDDDRYALTAAGHAAWGARPRGRPGRIALVEITPGTARAVMELRTHHTQEELVAPVAASFADALFPESVDGAPVVPWLRAIEADGELVGFVMLAVRSPHHSESYLWRLLVDRRHQRRGIGDGVITELATMLRAAGEETLLVSWHRAPGTPEPFYLARGFVPTGRIVEGEVEARLTL